MIYLPHVIIPLTAILLNLSENQQILINHFYESVQSFYITFVRKPAKKNFFLNLILNLPF